MTLASPLLRQVFSAVKKALKTYSEAQILFHFVPEQLILGSIENSSALYSNVEILCYSVYDRILQPVDRLMSRQLTEHERIRNYFQDPAFTLARPVYNKVSYVRAPHTSLDVMDRHTFLHVGYQISPCGKWILAACVDQRGEAHDVGVWLTQTPGDAGEEAQCAELYMVDKVWEFAVQFAKKANIEWRIVFAKLGAMGEIELVGACFLHLYILFNLLIVITSMDETSGECYPDMSRATTNPHHPPFRRTGRALDIHPPIPRSTCHLQIPNHPSPFIHLVIIIQTPCLHSSLRRCLSNDLRPFPHHPPAIDLSSHTG
jgi:hypothetical protein